jgi:hypothetical protein
MRPENNCVGEAQYSCNYRHVLSSERAPQIKKARKCLTVIINLAMHRRYVPDTKTDWPTDRR